MKARTEQFTADTRMDKTWVTQMELDLSRPLRVRAFKPGSQCLRILEWLRSGKTITPFEALQRFGTLALHSRISELRDAGWPIRCELVPTETGKQVGRYSL